MKIGLAIDTLRVLPSDFGPGRAVLNADSINVPSPSGRENILYGQIAAVEPAHRERIASIGTKIGSAGAGGLLGGIAAGAMAGGLTGPAGAVIGAIAGVIVAHRRTIMTCRITLTDGRVMLATAPERVWLALADRRRTSTRRTALEKQ